MLRLDIHMDFFNLKFSSLIRQNFYIIPVHNIAHLVTSSVIAEF